MESDQGHFQVAYELASVLHRYIQLVDGFRTHVNTIKGIMLAKYLLGYSVKKLPHSKLLKSMLQDILYIYCATGSLVHRSGREPSQ